MKWLYKKKIARDIHQADKLSSAVVHQCKVNNCFSNGNNRVTTSDTLPAASLKYIFFLIFKRKVSENIEYLRPEMNLGV